MARQGLPCTKHVTPCLEGREADLISINCEWPAGMLGPHMVFFGAVSQRTCKAASAETARCTRLL